MAYALRDYQTRAVAQTRRALMAGKKAPLLVSPTGCHPAGQGILLFDGRIVPVEKIAVNDLLMGPDSKPRRVRQIVRGWGEIATISPKKGSDFKVNYDHILTLVRTNEGKSNKGGEVVDVRLRDYLEWSRYKRHIYKLFRTGVDFQEATAKTLLPIDPYLLGIFLGDGCLLYGRVDVHNPEPEIIQSLREFADQYHQNLREEYAEGRCPALHFICKPFRTHYLRFWMKQLKIDGKSAHEKFIPHAYLTASRESRLELLAGIMDTDGSLSGSGYDFISASKILSENVVFLSRSLGLAAYMSECVKRCQNNFEGNYYRVSISGDCSVIPCRVKRKRAEPRKQKKDHLRTGFSVLKSGRDDYYGFVLDGDGRYLLDDFTVTHNSGKTVIACHIIERAHARKNRTLFLAHRTELIEQCSGKLAENGIKHGIIKAGFDPAPSLRVQVAGKDTLVRRLDKLRQDYRLIIIDEAHHAPAGTYQRILEANPHAIVLGLTATPYRMDGQGLNKTFDALVEVESVENLIAHGHLVPSRTMVGRKVNLKGIHTRAGDYQLDELGERMTAKPHIEAIVKSWLQHARDRITVCFATTVAHSMALTAAFLASGVAAEHLDGSTPAEERSDILTRLQRGQTRIVSNCCVLTEGWDCPPCSCIIAARPTQSRGLWRQMVGRVLRPYPGKSDCLILDHSNWTDDHGFITDPDTLSLENGIVKTPSNTRFKCRECGAILASKPRFCPACGTDTQPENTTPAQQTGAPYEMIEIHPEQYIRTPRQYTQAQQEYGFWNDLKTVTQKGYKLAWAYMRHKARSGQWPSHELQAKAENFIRKNPSQKDPQP